MTSIEKLIEKLEKLEIKDGNVCILRYETPIDKTIIRDFQVHLSRELSRTGTKIPKCIFLVLPKNMQVENLDELQMDKLGWCRKVNIEQAKQELK